MGAASLLTIPAASFPAYKRPPPEDAPEDAQQGTPCTWVSGYAPGAQWKYMTLVCERDIAAAHADDAAAGQFLPARNARNKWTPDMHHRCTGMGEKLQHTPQRMRRTLA